MKRASSRDHTSEMRWVGAVLALLACLLIVFAQKFPEPISSTAAECDKDQQKASAGCSQATTNFGTSNIAQCGNEMGCQAFDNEFKDGRCNNCEGKAQNKACCNKKPPCSEYTCQCSGGKEGCDNTYTVSCNQECSVKECQKCKAPCYDKAVENGNTKGKEAQTQQIGSVKGGKDCTKSPLDESKNCQESHVANDDRLRKAYADEWKKAQEELDKAKAAAQEAQMPKGDGAPQLPQPPQGGNGQETPKPPPAEPPKPVCSGNIPPDPTTNACQGTNGCQTDQGFEDQDSGPGLWCVHKDVRPLPSTTGAFLSITGMQGGEVRVGKLCWSKGQRDKMGPDVRKTIMDRDQIYEMGHDRDQVRDLVDSQLKIGGAMYGNDLVADNLKAMLNPEQAVAYRMGALGGGHVEGSLYALNLNRFNDQARLAIGKFDSENFPGAFGSGGRPPANGLEGGKDPMSGDGGQMAQQLFGKVLEAMQKGGEGEGKQPVAGNPGEQSIPAQTAIPNVDSGTLRMSDKTGGGCVVKDLNGKCIQASGAETSFSGGDPTVTPEGALVSTAGTVTQKVNPTEISLAARQVANPTLDEILGRQTQTQVVVASGLMPSGVSATAGAIFGSTPAVSVRMSDHVVVKEYDTLTVSRRPYDSTADEKPIKSYITNQVLPMGETYPSYRARVPGGMKPLVTDVLYFEGLPPRPSVSQITMGKLSSSVVRVNYNQDARVDLWSSKSYLSSIAQEKDLIRGLSTMVDERNIRTETIFTYFLDGRTKYDYVVTNGLVFRGDQRRILESSFGVPISTVPREQRKVVYS